MSESDSNHLYELKNYILEVGSIADKLRLISAGYSLPAEVVDEIFEELVSVLNKDGGVPFEIIKGNPSSVKETAELLHLVASFKESYPDLTKRMTEFLVSRQKNDGGFAETLNLNNLIEDRYGATWGGDFYPVGKSVTWLTGKALEALCLVNYEDQERIRRARDFLANSQNEDGYWPDFVGQNISDPLASGNIVSGLKAVGINSDSKVYKNARAALFQHLSDAINQKSTMDMMDLTAVGAPLNEKEKKVIKDGIQLIVQSQKNDGGWALFGSKKSDPELSSILAFVLSKCSKYK
ncbi:MAG: hypothetical protein ACFFAY_06595 [Promethearchaeota archaeon]